MTFADVESLYTQYANEIKTKDYMIDQLWDKITEAVQFKNYEQMLIHINEINTLKFQQKLIHQMLKRLEELLIEDQKKMESRRK